MSNHDNKPRVLVKPGAVANPETRGFQSTEAHERATAQVPEDDSVRTGLVADDDSNPIPNSKMVAVRVRQNVLNMRYGKATYTLIANKPTLVPEYVENHLREKGLL